MIGFIHALFLDQNFHCVPPMVLGTDLDAPPMTSLPIGKKEEEKNRTESVMIYHACSLAPGLTYLIEKRLGKGDAVSLPLSHSPGHPNQFLWSCSKVQAIAVQLPESFQSKCPSYKIEWTKSNDY